MKNFYRLENGFRVYDYSVCWENIFYSELLINLEDHINLNFKLYYLQFQSKHNFFLDNNDLNYLYNFDLRYNESLNYVFSENIKKIKCAQRNDLFFLTCLKKLVLLFLIPKLDKNNKYYYDLIIAVKSDFNINDVNYWILNSVNLFSVVELNRFNLSYNYVKKIFNIENNKFKDGEGNSEESNILSKEYLNRKSENWKFTKKGRRFFKKFIFKCISLHMYWFLSDDQICNVRYQIDFGFKEKMLLNNNKTQIIDFYSKSSFLDLISNSPEVLNVNWFLFYKHL